MSSSRQEQCSLKLTALTLMTFDGFMSETKTPRQRAREQTMADILRIGREHLTSQGAAALSLRAVARDLGVVSSAVYRYVSSRDELLTLLIVDAYNDLGNRVDADIAEASADPLARFFALAGAVRSWALGEPARYALLFGTPVPGYQAPAERTNDAGTRVVVALIAIIEDAWQTGDLHWPPAQGNRTVDLPSPLATDLETLRNEYGLTVPVELIARGMSCWSGLFGAVNFEVFGHFGDSTFTDAGEMFHQTIRLLALQLGLAPEADPREAP